MIKYCNYIFVLCIFLVSCGKELSSTELLLQGEWKFIKIPDGRGIGGGYEGHNLKSVNFKDDDFELQELYTTDVGPPFRFNLSFSGTYKVDTSFIYFEGVENKENFLFRQKTRYAFDEDTLILGSDPWEDQYNQNQNIPKHYFLKESN